MNKIWVWVGFPMGIGVLLLLLVVMGSEGGTGKQFRTVKTEDGDAKISFIDKKVGDGEGVGKGDAVGIFFTIKKNGKLLKTNKNEKQPKMYMPGMPQQPMGGPSFGPGFDEGLIGMKKGGVREIDVPGELISPEFGVPPNVELTFEVELAQIMQIPRGIPGHP